MKRRLHRCDDQCVCPRCGKKLFYSQRIDKHACIDPRCGWIEPKPKP